MKPWNLLAKIILLFSFFYFPIEAQTPDKNEFDEAGLKFSYPADWTLTDKSSLETQHLLLSKPGSSVLITIYSPREFIQSNTQFNNIQRKVLESFVTAISKTLDVPRNSTNQTFPCLDFNGRNITGTKISGLYNNEPSKGEIYPFVLGNRFITLVYMRTDKDGSQSDRVWVDLIDSLSFAGSDNKSVGSLFNSENIKDGILNGKALELKVPKFSGADYNAGIGGQVEVKVTIDETGKIISAKAISGNKSLWKSAESAAKKSSFSQTIQCDKPIQVTGIIIYNFPLKNN